MQDTNVAAARFERGRKWRLVNGGVSRNCWSPGDELVAFFGVPSFACPGLLSIVSFFVLLPTNGIIALGRSLYVCVCAISVSYDGHDLYSERCEHVCFLLKCPSSRHSYFFFFVCDGRLVGACA